VSGPVGCVTGAPDRSFAEVAGVATEAPLVDPAVRCPVEGEAPVLELDDGVDRLAGQDLSCILVDEVIAALDGIEHVPDPVVFLDVAERGSDTALGGSGVRAHRIELADDGDVAPTSQLGGCHQPSTTSTDDDGIEAVIHGQPPACATAWKRAGSKVRIAIEPMMRKTIAKVQRIECARTRQPCGRM